MTTTATTTITTIMTITQGHGVRIALSVDRATELWRTLAELLPS
jgi:hypothetical protein